MSTQSNVDKDGLGKTLRRGFLKNLFFRKVYSVDNPPPFMAAWQGAIPSGDSKEITSKFEKNATLEGTNYSRVVKGSKAIEGYFDHFGDGKNDARVKFDTLFRVNKRTFTGSYTFEWKDAVGNPKSQPANYTFVRGRNRILPKRKAKVQHLHSSDQRIPAHDLEIVIPQV